MVYYLDTSAFLKLIVAEPQTEALRAWVAEHRSIWSSQLLATEAMRAATRLGVDPAVVAEALDAVSLVLPAPATFKVAGRLAPAGLRTLDALHLATALEIGDDLEGVVTYDQRMTEGADAASMPVVAPA